MTIYPTLASQQGLGEFKQVFRWDLTFGPEFQSKIVAKADASFKIDVERLMLSCQSAEEPLKDLELAVAELRGVRSHQAGIANLNGEITFTFLDTMDNNIMNTVETWSNLEYMSSEASYAVANTVDDGTSWGSAKAPNEYKLLRGCKIFRLDGQKKRKYGIELLGVMYKSHNKGGSLESGSSEISKPQITLAYDGWVRLKTAN